VPLLQSPINPTQPSQLPILAEKFDE